jgi:predicted AlkP superfamily phosphohydrolase/phosphomutase
MASAIVIGLDAMDSSLAQSLAADGHMPVLAGLLERGVRAPTRNPEGLVVGGIWPSFATATWPGRHGFYCFRQLETGTYRTRRFTPHDIAGTPVWSSLSAAGRRCCVVDAPLTTLDQDIAGVQIVDWGTHDRMLAPAAVPAGVDHDLRSDLGHHPVIGKCDDYAHRGDWEGLVAALAGGAAAKTDLCLRLLAREPWNLFLAVYGEAHCAGHQLWSLHDPHWAGHDPSLRARLGDPLIATYQAIDRQLGRLLEQVPPEAAVVILLSHGIGPHHDGDHLIAEIVRRLEQARGRASLLRRGAEIAARRGDRSRRAVQRRLRPSDPRLVGASNVDGSRAFFPVPNNELYAGIRINLAGREPRGRIQRDELDEVLGWLADRILELVDADDGRPLVHRVVRVDDLFEGDRRDALPDLLVDWRRERPITSAASPTIGEVRGRYTGIRTGDHRPAGLVLAHAPGTEPRMLASPVDIVDIGPTVAAYLGVLLTDVEGKPLPDLLEPDPAASAAPAVQR